MTQEYESHGEFHVSWIHNILVVEPKGAFNKEGLLKLNKKIETLVTNASDKYWLRLELFDSRYTLGPIDSHQCLISSLEHSKQHGCVEIYVVGANNILERMFYEAAGEIGLGFHFSEDIGVEVKNLLEQGYNQNLR